MFINSPNNLQTNNPNTAFPKTEPYRHTSNEAFPSAIHQAYSGENEPSVGVALWGFLCGGPLVGCSVHFSSHFSSLVLPTPHQPFRQQTERMTTPHLMAETSTDYRQTIGRLSGDYRQTIDRLSTEYRQNILDTRR
jgi:hypothetical protein